MRRGLLASVVATTLVCFGVLGIVLGLGWSPRLGLDLKGGLSVVYTPDAGQHATTADLDTIVSIMTNRVNALGVSQPNIQTQGNQIVVQLPGIKNAQQALGIIGETAQLYFRPVLCGVPAYVPPTVPKGQKAVKPKYVVPNTKLCTGTQYAYTTAGYNTSTQGYTPPADDPAFTSSLTTSPAEDLPNNPVILNGPGYYAPRLLLGPARINGAVTNGSIISDAYPSLSTTNGWTVVFTLKGRGQTLFNALAAKYYQLPLADDLDGVVIAAPVLITNSFSGSGQITGNFTQQSSAALGLQLKYGSLPIRIHQLTATTVSPSLGASSLRAGLLAGLVGLILVMGYTIFYYRALGVVVVLGLVTTAAFLYGVISMLGQSSLGLTLDLSGVTGLIVSVGITVDSYVVYFERLKDEIRAGRSVRASVDRGFRSAYRTILSADAVSFIGALVLWLLSVGAVRGFAFFLGLSTIVDVITAYLFTRPLVILLGRNRIFTDARHFGIARGLAARPADAP